MADKVGFKKLTGRQLTANSFPKLKSRTRGRQTRWPGLAPKAWHASAEIFT